MLLPRILTAIVGIPLLLIIIHLGSLPFLLLILVVIGLALYEYGNVLEAGGFGSQKGILIASGLLLAASLGLTPPSLDPQTAGRLPACALTVVLMAAVLRELFRKEHVWARAALSVFGVLFIAWTLSHVVLIRALRPGGEKLTYLLFLLIWAGDTAAYFTGKRWGRRKLAPIVSPHKTWEGLLGGVLAGSLTGWLFCKSTGLEASPPEALFLGAAVVLVAQLSDLSESLLKRNCGVKDSAALLPGHGGILDRFDSFYLASPLFFYYWAFKLD